MAHFQLTDRAVKTAIGIDTPSGRGSYGLQRYDQPVLDGHADEFFTVCDGCHDLFHTTDDGKRRPQDEWDAIIAQPKSEMFPEPVVPQTNGLIPLVAKPDSWSRMTAKQQAGWVRSVMTTLRVRFPKLRI